MKSFKYFEENEFACKCCGNNLIKESFVEMLDKARELSGVPFKITSGYRCLRHNREIGSNDRSPHLTGYASDIYCDNSTKRFAIIKALLEVGFERIGIGKDFIHVDSDKRNFKDKKIIWLY